MLTLNKLVCVYTIGSFIHNVIWSVLLNISVFYTLWTPTTSSLHEEFKRLVLRALKLLEILTTYMFL